MQYKKTLGENAFDWLNCFIMITVLVITIYPFLHILAVSLNEARDAAAGGIGIWPRVFSVDSYETVFGFPNIFNAMLVSVARTLVGTLLSLIVSSAAAYALVDNKMKGYKLIYNIFVVSMFVNGGLIPTFMLNLNLGLYDSFWVYILPGMFSVFNMILFRTYILQLPYELFESALIDGAGDFRIYAQIIMPLCLPIIATLALFVAVNQWNAWRDTLFFTKSESLETLQYVMMKVIRQAEAASMAKKARSLLRPSISVTPESIKMAITIIATLPILVVYPFLQRFFIKGMVIGAVKG